MKTGNRNSSWALFIILYTFIALGCFVLAYTNIKAHTVGSMRNADSRIVPEIIYTVDRSIFIVSSKIIHVDPSISLDEGLCFADVRFVGFNQEDGAIAESISVFADTKDERSDPYNTKIGIIMGFDLLRSYECVISPNEVSKRLLKINVRPANIREALVFIRERKDLPKDTGLLVLSPARLQKDVKVMRTLEFVDTGEEVFVMLVPFDKYGGMIDSHRAIIVAEIPVLAKDE